MIDNGPGVSADVRDKLFQPFFTTKRTGLGMGLSICQSILESLGGRIDLKNHDGKGAAFCRRVAADVTNDSPANVQLRAT